jgi:hypothetical protein
MKSSEFAGKFVSKYLWGNLLAMVIVVILLSVGVKFGLDFYTHHGEAIPVPNIRHKTFGEMESILSAAGLRYVVSDTGYVKNLPADCVLEQEPAPGERVKSGHIIYITINALHTPTITLPDVIDNSSLREAMAKLTAIGFKLGQPQYVAGEKDWVYGIIVRGRHVVAGDRISIEDKLIIEVGNGLRDEDDSVDYIDPVYPEFEEVDESEQEDQFEEVKEAPAQPQTPVEQPQAPVKHPVQPQAPPAKEPVPQTSSARQTSVTTLSTAKQIKAAKEKKTEK